MAVYAGEAITPPTELSDEDAYILQAAKSNFPTEKQDPAGDGFGFAIAARQYLLHNSLKSAEEKRNDLINLAKQYTSGDLEYLSGLRDTKWGKGVDYKPEKGYTNADVEKAKEITGGETITRDMVRQWGEYLRQKAGSKYRQKAGSKYKIGDTKNIAGVTYTFNGQTWDY